MLPEAEPEPGQLPAEPSRSTRLRREQRQLAPGRRRHIAQFQLDSGDRRRRRRRLDPGQEEPFHGQTLGRGLGQALVDDQRERHFSGRECAVQLEGQPGPAGGRAARD